MRKLPSIEELRKIWQPKAIYIAKTLGVVYMGGTALLIVGEPFLTLVGLIVMSKEEIKVRKGHLKICIIAYPYSKTTRAWPHLFKFVKILEQMFDGFYLITGNIPDDEIPYGKFQLINFSMEKELRRHLPPLFAFPIWLFNFVIGQIKMTYYLLKVSKAFDTGIFFTGGDACLPAVLLCKILRKDVITVVLGYTSQSVKVANGRFYFYIFKLLEMINRALSDKIIIETAGTIQGLKLGKYENKALVGGQLYVDSDFFWIKRPFSERKNIVGYISRLSKGKGILNFVDAVPLMANYLNDIEFLIGSNGYLLPEIKSELKRNGFFDRVTITGWIPYEQLPDYMNRLKLLVLPSYSETGIPSVILEAMSCGTPVLTTATGGISEAIIDGRTGFILRNNSPEQIAKDVVRILKHPHIDEIVKNACKLVEKEYTFEAVVKRYKNMLYRERTL